MLCLLVELSMPRFATVFPDSELFLQDSDNQNAIEIIEVRKQTR